MPLFIRKQQERPESPSQRGEAWTPERGLRIPHQPTPENMPKLAEIVVKGAGQMHHHELDYSHESLHWLDRLLDSFGREGSAKMAEMVLCAGAYVGEVLVRHDGYEWVLFPNDVALEQRFSTGVERDGVRGNPLGAAFDVVDHGYPDFSVATVAERLSRLAK